MKETCLSLLVTAPEAYAARLMEALKSADHVGGVSFRPLSVPLIETVIPKTNDAVAQLLERLDDVDYLAFSSRKAIESLALQLERNERVLPARVKCCAIGKDNEYLTERLGIAPAFVSDEPSPAGIVKMLSATPYIYGKRIAVLTPQVEGIAEPDVVPRFVAGLEETGMTVERISAYVTRATPSEWQEEACRLIHRKEVECVVFTSGTEISVLLHALSLYTPDIHAFLADIRIVCYGPYTASHARKLGLPVDFVSAHFGSFGEFTRSLTEFYS